jgi:two-component system alkaline phosphatase synthesis response regulator PhoP
VLTLEQVAPKGVPLSARILLVEDDKAIAAFVATALEREGCKITRAHTGRETLAHIQRSTPNLVLLDLMLPSDIDGLQVCQAARRLETYVPIIMVTAKDEDIDKIVGLEMGADDYDTKPFNARELLARARAVLRLVRSGGDAHQRLRSKIEPDPANPRYLLTVHSIGYKFAPEEV